MATDYNGKYSAKFDATQIKVIPEGKGYLELSARKSPARSDCTWGGELVSGNKCLIHEFETDLLQPVVNYIVCSNQKDSGVFYLKVKNSCPYGGDDSRPMVCKIFPSMNM